MKKVSNLILIGIFCLMLVGCTSSDEVNIGSISNRSVTDDLISLSAKDGTVTKTGITLVMENNTNERYIYGEEHFLEYYNDGVWHELIPLEERFFVLIGYLLEPGEFIQINKNWTSAYGRLSPGRYRVIKSVSPDLDRPVTQEERIYIAAEFIIE